MILTSVGPATASALSLAGEALVRDLTPFVATLARPRVVYNYSRGTPSNDPHLTDLREQFANAVRETRRLFSTLDRRIEYTGGDGNTSAGIPGVYVALDPVTSGPYGGRGSDWRLVMVSLPRGLRYLRLSVEVGNEADWIEAPLSFFTKRRLAREGCAETSASFLMSPANAACARIALATLEALDVQALSYAFSVQFQKRCPGQSRAAMLLLDSKIVYEGLSGEITERDVKTTPNAPIVDLMRNIVSLADSGERRELAIERFGRVTRPMANMGAWLEANMVGCGPEPEPLRAEQMIPGAFPD